MTVATEKTDAFLRYIRSAEINKLKGKVSDKLYINVRFQVIIKHYIINVMRNSAMLWYVMIGSRNGRGMERWRHGPSRWSLQDQSAQGRNETV